MCDICETLHALAHRDETVRRYLAYQAESGVAVGAMLPSLLRDLVMEKEWAQRTLKQHLVNHANMLHPIRPPPVPSSN